MFPHMFVYWNMSTSIVLSDITYMLILCRDKEDTGTNTHSLSCGLFCGFRQNKENTFTLFWRDFYIKFFSCTLNKKWYFQLHETVIGKSWLSRHIISLRLSKVTYFPFTTCIWLLIKSTIIHFFFYPNKILKDTDKKSWLKSNNSSFLTFFEIHVKR